MNHSADPATDAFIAHRNLLFTVAYEMLGSAADAEDVLQETWLRWIEVRPQHVRDQRAYLVRITTRQSLNRLRAMKRRREAYVGPWLPEPLLTAPDVADDVELAESVSLGLMLVLETLSPTERAVFVLREAFDVSYDEIAAAIGKSTAAVHQIAHRARRHVDARRPVRSHPPARPGRLWRPSNARWKPGTCRACSKCSLPTSSWWETAAASSRPHCGRSSARRRLPACSSVVWATSKAPSPLNRPWSTATRHCSYA
ncbi:hypothetical protein CS0771_53990 [Catellatospora sp. IY07-71]|nr:hypothetical protein CS0771_53990 [Catellatospora sp. IY07-71]